MNTRTHFTILNLVVGGLAMLLISACSIASPGFRFEMVQAALSSDKNGHYRLHGRTASSLFARSQDAKLANAACSKNAASEVPALVKAGANVNARGKQGITLLIWAMSCHNHQGIKALLAAGADPNLPMAARKINDQGHRYWVLGQTNCAKRPFQNDFICQPPVYLAAGGDDPKTLSLLLDHGGNQNAVNQNYESALMNAVSSNRFNNMQILMARNANPNYCPDRRGHGVLFSAANRFDMVIYMVRHAVFTRANLKKYADFYLSKDKKGSHGFFRGISKQDIEQSAYLRFYPEVVEYFKSRNIIPYRHRKRALPPPPNLDEMDKKQKEEEKKRKSFLKQRRQEGRPCPGNNAQIDSFGKYYCAPIKHTW